MPPNGKLTLDELRAAVRTSEIDTVIVGFCDMQGRLMGKRAHATAFVDGMAAQGVEGCNYLLAVDVDMNTVTGYAFASWERGYGDFVLRPDIATLRRIPWLEGHGPLPVRPAVARRLAGHAVAPSDPARPARAAGGARLACDGRIGARVPALRRELRGVPREGLSGSPARERLQRRLLDPRFDLCRARPARDPARHGRRRHAGRGLEGRVQLRPARGELPLRGRARDGRQPHGLPQRREGDRAPARTRADLHAQVRRARGQLVPHPHLALGCGAQPLP